MKVLTTCTDQIDGLASLLRDAFQQVDIQLLEAGEIEPDRHDAALLLAGYDSDDDRTLVRKLISQIRNLSLDIPIILLHATPEPDRVTEGLRIGAADVIAFGADQHLLHVIRRVLRERELRRERDFWQRRHALSERRCERLMDSSRDAIALIADGIHIYANAVYAAMLGLSAEDTLLSPVADILDTDMQGELKPLLRPLSATEPLVNSL